MAPSALGDALMTTGAIGSLIAHFKGAEITLETTRRTMPLFENFPGITRRHERHERFEKLLSPLWLRTQSFDLGILLDNSVRRAQMLRRGGVPRTVGIRERPDEMFLDESVSWDPDGHDKFDPLAALLRLLEADEDVRPRIYPASAHTDAAARAFAGMHPAPSVGLVISASVPQKCWPIDRVVALARRLEREGVRVAAIGGLDDDVRLNALKAEGVPIAPIIRHPLVLAEFLKRFEVVVANDSGPAHLAAVAGVPTAVIYIATLPQRGAPMGVATRLIHAGQQCDIYVNRCEGSRETGVCDRRCQTAIGVDQVYDATRELLTYARSNGGVTSVSRP